MFLRAGSEGFVGDPALAEGRDRASGPQQDLDVVTRAGLFQKIDRLGLAVGPTVVSGQGFQRDRSGTGGCGQLLEQGFARFG